MIKKRLKLIVIIFFLVLNLMGCWDAMDINKKNIITAVVVDCNKTGYELFAEIPNLSMGQSQEGGSGDGNKQYSVLRGSGKDFAEAQRNIENKMENTPYLGSNRIVLFTERLASEGVEEYLYRMREDTAYRKAGKIATTHEDPKKLLEIRSENEKGAGFAIESLLETMIQSGRCIKIATSDVLERVLGGRTIIMPDVGMEDEDFILKGYTILKNGKLIGDIPFEESKGLVCFYNENAKWDYVIPFGNNRATLEAQLSGKHIKPYYSNGKISFTAEFTFNVKMQHMRFNEVFDKLKQQEVSTGITNKLLNEIYQTVETAMKYQSDYLRFYIPFRIAYPHEFDKMDWDTEFTKAIVSIDVKIKFDPSNKMDYEEPIS